MIKIALMADTIDRRPEKTMVARRLAEYLLTRDDVELTLIHYQSMPDDLLYKEAQEVLIKPVTFPIRSRFLSFVRFALTTKERYDVVHWLVGRVYPFFWLLPTRTTIVTAYDGGSVLAPGAKPFSTRVYNAVLRYFYRSIAAVVGGSDFGSEQIVRAYGIPRNLVPTVYVGIDEAYKPLPEAAVKPVLAKHALTQSGYILYVGGMQPHKNVAALVRAYALYRKSGRTEKLVLVGDPSYGTGEVQKAIDACGYASDVMAVRYAPAEELPALYNGALMYAHPSLNEGFGLPPIEAMACGTPVVSSNAASLPEVTGGAGLLIDPDDEKGFSDAMLKVANDNALQAELSKKGIERAKTFTWKKMGETYVSLYHSVLSHEKN